MDGILSRHAVRRNRPLKTPRNHYSYLYNLFHPSSLSNFLWAIKNFVVKILPIPTVSEFLDTTGLTHRSLKTNIPTSTIFPYSPIAIFWATENSMVRISPSPAVRVSPAVTAPTPAGVPVSTRSPGCRVKYLEM